MLDNCLSGASRRKMEYCIHLFEKTKAKLYTMLLSRCFYSIGKKTTIIPPLRFGNLSKIELGNHVTIHSHCWIQVLRENDQEGLPKLIIKDYAAIGMDATISAVKRITIEENVFLARNVYISDHGHEYHDIKKPIAYQGIRKVEEVRIGANSWLGQNSVILPGVNIGRNCVIGANSVVNRNIPDYSVVAGIPAKVIRVFNDKTGVWERVGLDE